MTAERVTGERTNDKLDRLGTAVELAVRIAAGQLDARLLVSDAGDEVDALIASLNMLAEELDNERRTRTVAEEQLADERDTYDRAPALFCSLDGQTLVVEKCNQTLADALGLTKAQILGSSLLALCPLESRTEVERLLRKSVLDGRPHQGELALLTASQRKLMVSASVNRIRAQERERLRIVGKDVTVEKHLEAQLLQAQKMEAVGRLSGGVAHDFNNILAVIMTASEFLRETLTEHDLPLEDAEMIRQASARGAALTNDLLAFSRQRVVQLVPTDLTKVVEETERMVARLVGDDIRVAVNLAPEPIVCSVDASQVSQVLLNLAINARDAMPNGGTLTFEAGPRVIDGLEANELVEMPAGSYALLEVSDTGVGMTPEVAARAFEPFFSTKPLGQGTGLGLSMCYGIVRQAGGRIAIYSEVGRGTTIKIYLPLVAAAPRNESVQGGPVLGGHETLLVVEDDETLRALTRRILEGGGYHVLVAANGRDALDVVAKNDGPLALVVTDVMMPEMGGRELATALATLRPKLRVLYLSGFTANVIVKQGVLEPGISFLPKPFTAAALLTAVRQMLDVAVTPGLPRP